MLIGLAGKARSGKDTIAAYLAERYDFIVMAVADKFKEIFADVYGLKDKQLYGDLKEVVDPRFGVTPRYIMQTVGHSFRSIDPDVWVKYLEKKIIRTFTFGYDMVVTDIRMPNEAMMIRRQGGSLIKVERDGAQASGGVENHISETALDGWVDWDLVIQNNLSLENLYQQVEQFLKEHKHDG